MSAARNVQFTVKSGKVDEFKRLMHTEVLPLMKKENGFRQAITVVDKNTGMSISVWDDRASVDNYNTKVYPEVLKTLSPVLDGTPRVDTYDTIFATVPELVQA